MVKDKKNISTILLIVIFAVLLIIYFLIPNTRNVTKTISVEEYKNQIYGEMYKKLKPDELETEESSQDELNQENEIGEDNIIEDELLMLNH